MIILSSPEGFPQVLPEFFCFRPVSTALVESSKIKPFGWFLKLKRAIQALPAGHIDAALTKLCSAAPCSRRSINSSTQATWQASSISSRVAPMLPQRRFSKTHLR